MHDADPNTMHDLLRDAIPIAGEPLVCFLDSRKKAEKKPERRGAKQGIDYEAIELSRLVGERMRDIRIAKNLSLETMHRRGAPTASMLSKIERGAVNPRLETLVSIAKALDVSPAQLFYDSNQIENDDALFVAANVDTFTAKRLLFLYQEQGLV